MKIGYPCINRSIGCRANSTFRLASYSEGRLVDTVANNLNCLAEILKYNVENGLLFFRITSDLVPFASHPVCKFDWVKHFRKKFRETGDYIKNNNIRISMHPDQFVLINSPDKDLVKRSVAELDYHCRALDSMGLDASAKIQIHVGGVYGDRESAIQRFVDNYKRLAKALRERLVIENDDRSFGLKDCLSIHDKTEIPVVFDVLHHQCVNDGEDTREALLQAQKTWRKKDGILMVDYSSQKKGGRKCSHTDRIDMKLFKKFIGQARGLDFDIMLEIKDKERSAIEAIRALRELKRV